MNTFDKQGYLVVGRFGRPHGVRGEVSVQSFTDPSDNILNYHTWFSKKDGQWQELKILNIRESTKSYIVYIDGCETRDDAALLTNSEIAVSKESLPELAKGEYYWHQLEGMQVVNTDNVVYGCVQEIMHTGANDVLVVNGDKRRLIPYLFNRVILDVDLKAKKITVNWDADF